jgi:hypothetical protein
MIEQVTSAIRKMIAKSDHIGKLVKHNSLLRRGDSPPLLLPSAKITAAAPGPGAVNRSHFRTDREMSRKPNSGMAEGSGGSHTPRTQKGGHTRHAARLLARCVGELE